MSFLARLATDMIVVETGATTPLSVDITNREDNADQFELVVEGLDPEWTAIPVPVVTIQGRESQQEKVFFKPPRSSESSAGNYPFVVKVRSLTTGDSRTIQGVLAVKPFDLLSLEINPKKGVVSPTRKQNKFEVNLVNLGNTEHSVQLFGSDPEEACAFEFDQQQVTLGPGQQKTLSATVTPKASGFLSGSRLYGFTISIRSLESPNVGAVAQAQLEQRPLLTVGNMVFLAIVLVFVAAWIALIPKPPSFDLSVDKTTVERGQPVTISWKSGADVTMVHLKAQDRVIYEGSEREGSKSFAPTLSATQDNFEIDGYSERDGRLSLTHKIVVTVVDPPKVEPPTIQAFDVTPRNPALGSMVIIRYLVHNASGVSLQPMGMKLDANNDQLTESEVEIHSLDYKQLTLVATNSKGQTVIRNVPIHVVQASKAKIIAFLAEPDKLTGPGPVKLSWQVNDFAVRTELVIDGHTEQVDPKGSRDLNVTATSKITLKCFDNAGVPDQKIIILTIPAPTPPSTGTDPASTGTELPNTPPSNP